MRGIGYFLGALIGAFLMFAVINFIFFKPRSINEADIKQYIKSSDQKLIINPIPLLTEYNGSDPKLGGKTLSKITYFSNRNMSYVRADTYTYFSDKLNKYIRTYSISETGNMSSVILRFGKEEKDRNKYPDMIFYYNKTQNADTTFGTIDKPLSILHFRSSNPALRSMWLFRSYGATLFGSNGATFRD